MEFTFPNDISKVCENKLSGMAKQMIPGKYLGNGEIILNQSFSNIRRPLTIEEVFKKPACTY